jgi:hypothetical protein
MAGISPFSRKVVKAAFPALLLAFMIFLTLMFVIRYTDAFYIVIVLWITVPVLAVKAWRRLKSLCGLK